MGWLHMPLGKSKILVSSVSNIHLQVAIKVVGSVLANSEERDPLPPTTRTHTTLKVTPPPEKQWRPEKMNFYKIRPQSKSCCFKEIRIKYDEKKKTRKNYERIGFSRYFGQSSLRGI